MKLQPITIPRSDRRCRSKRRRGIIHLLPVVILLAIVLIVLLVLAFTDRGVPLAPVPDRDESPRTASRTKSPDADRNLPDHGSAASAADKELPATANGARPAWIGQSPHKETRQGVEVYVAAVSAGPFTTDDECDRALGIEIDKAIGDYAERLHPDALQPIGLDPQFTEQHLIADRWRGTVDSPSVGPMREAHALLVFDARANAELDRQHRGLLVGERLKYAAVGTLSVLMVLACAHSFLKWDHKK